MLVLSRKAGEGITVNQDISIEILSIEGDRVRIGIQAPKDVRIYRSELLDQTIDLNRAAVKTPNISFGVAQPVTD